MSVMYFNDRSNIVLADQVNRGVHSQTQHEHHKAEKYFRVLQCTVECNNNSSWWPTFARDMNLEKQKAAVSISLKSPPMMSSLTKVILFYREHWRIYTAHGDIVENVHLCCSFFVCSFLGGNTLPYTLWNGGVFMYEVTYCDWYFNDRIMENIHTVFLWHHNTLICSCCTK